MIRAAALALAALAAAPACTGRDAVPVPTCAALTDHLIAVSKRSPIHIDRAAELEQCETRALTPAERHCLLAASTLDAMARCRRR